MTTYELDGRDPYVRQDLVDLEERWSARVAAGDMEGARRAYEAIVEYTLAGQTPEVDGPDRVLVRVTKEAHE